jgi:hypothetical protein
MATNTQVTELPTVSYGSFTSQLDKFAEAGGAPTELHPSVFDKKTFNGSTIALLVKAFRALGLTNEKNEPIPDRLDALIDVKTRKDAFQKLLRDRYATLIALPLEKANPAQFNEWFSKTGMASEAQRKAKTFFLHAARANGVAVSKYILEKSNTRTPAKRDKKRQAKPGSTNGGNVSDDIKRNTAENDPTFADKILAKFPDFDPTWTPEVQQKWFEGIARLQDGFKKSEGPE